MADYNGMEALLASTENLTQLLNNVGHDDDTPLTFNGVDWFKFNGTVAQSICVSGNSWFGRHKRRAAAGLPARREALELLARGRHPIQLL